MASILFACFCFAIIPFEADGIQHQRGIERSLLGRTPTHTYGSDKAALDEHGHKHLLQLTKREQEQLEESIKWDVCNCEVYSNLGGLGGNNPPGTDLTVPEIRYKEVAKTTTGKTMDLVVTNTTEYKANPSNPTAAAEAGDKTIGSQFLNGKNECLGRINVGTPSSVVLKFRMVWSGTNDLVDADYTYDFSLFDFDMSKQGTTEQIAVSGIDSWSSGMTPDVVDGVYTFSATHVAVTNPTSPFELTPEQEAASVAFVYSTAEWDITLKSIDTKNTGRPGGRNFEFSGKSSMTGKRPNKAVPPPPKEVPPPPPKEAPPPPPKEAPCEKGPDGTCVIYQDPHIDTFDNPNQGPFLTRVAAFDSRQKLSLLGQSESLVNVDRFWQAGTSPNMDVNVYEKGDFWLVKNEHIQIQGRYSDSAEFGEGHSGLAGLAVSGPVLEGGILLVGPKNGEITCFGERLAPQQEYLKKVVSGEVYLKSFYNAFTDGGVAPDGLNASLPSGIFLEVRRYNTHMDAKITMPQTAGSTDGQCGNFNGDPYDDSLGDVEKRMVSMRVGEKESLFSKQFSL